MYVRTYVSILRTYVRTYVRTNVRAYVRTYVHTYLRTYVLLWRAKLSLKSSKANQLKQADSTWLSLIHISEPTRQEAISYAVFCLKKKWIPKNPGRLKRREERGHRSSSKSKRKRANKSSRRSRANVGRLKKTYYPTFEVGRKI